MSLQRATLRTLYGHSSSRRPFTIVAAMIKLTTVALTCLLSCGSMTTVTATITYNDPLGADAGGGTTTTNSNRLRGIRPQEQDKDATAMNNNIKLDQEQEAAAADEAAANYFLRGIRSSDPEESQESQPTNPQEEVEPASMILSPQQEAPPIGSTKPKIRTKTKPQSSHQQPQSSQLTSLQTFAQNMLTNQGCPPTTTTSCGDICYVLTPAAASDLHSVAIGHSSTPTHHWHDPTSFWQTGVCNAKSQCVSVNPFDRGHDFVDLTNTLAEVERECERNVGMGTMFVLAKAMEPPSWVKGGGGNKRR